MASDIPSIHETARRLLCALRALSSCMWQGRAEASSSSGGRWLDDSTQYRDSTQTDLGSKYDHFTRRERASSRAAYAPGPLIGGARRAHRKSHARNTLLRNLRTFTCGPIFTARERENVTQLNRSAIFIIWHNYRGAIALMQAHAPLFASPFIAMELNAFFFSSPNYTVEREVNT